MNFPLQQKYDSCTLISRLDEDLTNSKIEITIAKPVEEVMVETLSDLVAGQDGGIKCTIKGGRPAPIVSMEFDNPAPEMVNDTVSQTPGL